MSCTANSVSSPHPPPPHTHTRTHTFTSTMGVFRVCPIVPMESVRVGCVAAHETNNDLMLKFIFHVCVFASACVYGCAHGCTGVWTVLSRYQLLGFVVGRIYPCPMGAAACPSSSNGSCAVGYMGVMCGVCQKGYHATGAACLKCQGATQYSIVIIIFAVAAAIGAFWWYGSCSNRLSCLCGCRCFLSFCPIVDYTAPSVCVRCHA